MNLEKNNKYQLNEKKYKFLFLLHLVFLFYLL